MKYKNKVLSVRPTAFSNKHGESFFIKDGISGKVLGSGSNEKMAWNAARIMLWREILANQTRIRISKNKKDLNAKEKFRITKDRILKRDGHRCVKCGCEDITKLTIDHLLPKAVGGSDEDYNLATMCEPCNNKKGKKIVQRWIDLMYQQLKENIGKYENSKKG